MKIKKSNTSMNAGTTEIKNVSFDSTKESTIDVEGKTFARVEFLDKGNTVATLGASGLSFAHLADEGNKPVGSVVALGSDKEAEFKLPARGGVISSYDITDRMRKINNTAIKLRIAEGAKFYQPVITGWKGADFARA